ncbi:hypothetical protein [Rhodococcus sp. NPDC058521]|uniref:hypothetical protein n=1 Tax=Rhodococcus sp. NPDC058521 TaxID=3346536 RepID=UPI003653A399
MSGEQFRAEPEYVAGLGVAFAEIGKDSQSIADFVGKNGPPGEFFSGPIISTLLEPFTSAAERTKARMSDIARVNTQTSLELNKAAWMYDDQEAKNFAALNEHTKQLGGRSSTYNSDVEVEGTTAAYDVVTAFPKVEQINLDEPSANREDLAALISEASGWLGDVNEAIKSTTRMAGVEWDALGTVLKPITGNWTELNRIGEAYKIAGNAFEASAKNLDDGVNRVGQHWDGKAALAFEDHARKQSEAMRWEGPVGRTIALGLGVVAEEIREAIKTVIRKLEELLESQVSLDGIAGKIKFLVRKVPAIQAATLGKIIWDVGDMILDLVDEIRVMVDSVKEFLSTIADPVGKAHEKLDEKLSPITSRIDDATRRAAVAMDIKNVSDFGSTLDRPKDGYDVGSGKDPWADG